ncbi:MAG: hypothetical protein ACFFDY_10540 [Candidatus Thorarchaeota archaeon]
MAKKRFIMNTSIAAIISTLIIISTPILFISSHLLNYGTYITQEPLNFRTGPNSPSIETLNLNVDVGNITINYIDPSDDVDSHVKIEVYIKMRGSQLAGKSYEDYLNITWQENSPQKNFTLEVISDDWFDPLIWYTQKIEVVVTIRKGIIFDILATVTEGDVEVVALWRSSFKNLIVNVTNGDITYDFNHCIIEGNITGITNEGALKFKSYNAEYTQNSNWMLNSNDTFVEIYQYKEMGANITGTAIITTGIIDLFYHDNTADIGALFPFPYSYWFIPTTQPGFEYTILDEGFFYESTDFPANSNYNISFYHLGGLGERPNHIIEIKSE